MPVSRRWLVAVVLLVLALGAASTWWAIRREGELGAQVAALAAPGDIRMLASDSCAICAVARTWFRAHQVAYSECSIERDAACRQAFEASRSPGTPVLLVRGQVQLGFNPQRVRAAL
jgi:hypothetical protein